MCMLPDSSRHLSKRRFTASSSAGSQWPNTQLPSASSQQPDSDRTAACLLLFKHTLKASMKVKASLLKSRMHTHLAGTHLSVTQEHGTVLRGDPCCSIAPSECECSGRSARMRQWGEEGRVTGNWTPLEFNLCLPTESAGRVNASRLYVALSTTA